MLLMRMPVSFAFATRRLAGFPPAKLQTRRQQSRVQLASADPDAVARQIAEAVHMGEAQAVWEAWQSSGQPVHIDVVNAYLGKSVTTRLRRPQAAPTDPVALVRKLKDQGLRPNLATLSILAQLLPSSPPSSTLRAFLEREVNALCRDLLRGLRTAAEQRAQGWAVVQTCDRWARTYASAPGLSLDTHATALEALGRHLGPSAVLRVLKQCQAAHPVTDATAADHCRLYRVAAHVLFAKQRYKRLLMLFFEMHNQGIGPLPPELGHCALWLCSRLQPRHTPALFRWLAADRTPDPAMYRFLLDAHAGLRDVDAATGVLEAMKAAAVPPTPDVYAAVMRAYRRRRGPEDARRLLDAYTEMRRECAERPAAYAPYKLALWAVKRLTPSMPAGEGQTLRRQILTDAKSDGHTLFWFLHS